MKYIHYFEENITEKSKDIEKIFENSRWLVIRPKSYESLLSWSQGTKWNIENVNAKYWSEYGSPRKYDFNDKIYICFDNKYDAKYLFDFDTEHFYDNDGDYTYISELFDRNKELISVFGDIIYCSDVVEQNGEYWIVVDDYDYFVPYFKLDSRVRTDYIEKVLGGDGYEIYNYSYKDFDIDVNIKLDKDNIELLKMILRLELLFDEDGDYDYDVDEIEDYGDITSIVDEYRLNELKRTLQRCICELNETSNADSAYDDILDRIYKFFNLVDGSAKWEKYNSKNEMLWIKFNTKLAAYNAKLIITNYDDSYSDEKIDGDPPDNGYYMDNYDGFNDILPDKVTDYSSENVDGDTISEYYNLWRETTKENPTMSIDDIMKDIDLKIDAKKYNL